MNQRKPKLSLILKMNSGTNFFKIVMKKCKIYLFSAALLTGVAAFAEFQYVNDNMAFYDPDLLADSDVNVSIDSIDNSDALQVMAGGFFVDLNSVTSTVNNVNTPSAEFYAGNAWGDIKGDVRTEISNSSFKIVFGGSLASSQVGFDASGNIGGSTYLTFNSGFVSGSIAGGSNLSYQHKGNIGGSTNLTINGGTIGGNVVAGGINYGGVSETNTSTSANLLINASNPANKISIGGYVCGIMNDGHERTEKVSIIFTGNGENLDFTGTVSSIQADSYSSSTTWYASANERVISFGSGEDAFVGQFNGTINNGKIAGQNQFNELKIGKDSSVKFTQDFDLNVDTLSIFSNAEVLGNATITVDDALNIFISDSFSGTDLVFELGESIVLSAESQSNVSILHEDGSLFDGAEFAYDPITNSFAISNIPESSTYASIFGALALAFAAYRRRK